MANKVDNKKLKSLSDDELRELYIKSKNKYVGDIADEVQRRITERCPITSTKEQLEEVEALSNGTFSFDRFLYTTPYSCMLEGKRVWFKSVKEMYYRLTKNDKYYKEEHKCFTESEWWLGYTHPTSYEKWLSDRGIVL